MFFSTESEIAASPEECRKVFLDWKNWDKIGTDVIRSILRIPPEISGPVEKGEKLNVNFSGMNIVFVVQENIPEGFKWRYDMIHLISGIHSYRFESSKVTPGSTRFVNSEEFLRLSNVFMTLTPIEKMFYQFSKQFKASIESVKESALKNEEAA